MEGSGLRVRLTTSHVDAASALELV